MAKVIKSEEFDKEVLNANETILVDFFATWCGPCKMVAPILDELSEELKEKAKIFKVDVDESRDLASKYGVSSVPTMIIFKDGKEVDKIVGFQPKEILKQKISNH